MISAAMTKDELGSRGVRGGIFSDHLDGLKATDDRRVEAAEGAVAEDLGIEAGHLG